MAPLRIIFMGTAELAGASLRALSREKSFDLVAVVSQPDKPKGRELKVQPTPVKAVATASHLAVLQPKRARDETFIAELRHLKPDLIAVAAYGQILPPAILDLPRYGCLNVHTSLLPRYRGAAPIQWAILNGEAETGVTIMKMDAGLDTGDILSHVITPITPDDNAQTLHDRLALIGAELLVQTIPDYVSGKIVPRPQPAEGATHARKITKDDGRLDWSQSALQLWNRVRGLVPWPGAFTHYVLDGSPRLLKVWQAEAVPGPSSPPGTVISADRSGIVVACGEGALRILQLQREGGRRLTAQAFLAGCPIPVGTLLEK